MKKTNIRIYNFFVFEKGKQYYLTDIDQLDEWKDTKTSDLKPFLKNNVTKQLQILMKQYPSNVNFIVDDFKENYSTSKEQVKTISVTKGGWGKSKNSSSLDLEGGWSLSNKPSLLEGGWEKKK